MSDRRRVKSDPKQGECAMSNSIAAEEAFQYLNAGTRLFYRGQGDTPTAARDRAAVEAGITPAQGERVWKRWRDMKSPNGDVYRALRNAYGHLCESIEIKAQAVERLAQKIEEENAALQGAETPLARVAEAACGEEGEMK
jgi:hypothetical protein